jgi:type IV secretion system protein VirB10
MEPEMRRADTIPKGVLPKNLKPALYLSAVALVIVAAVFSSFGKRAPAHQAAGANEVSQSVIQDNTDNNVQTMKSHVAEARQRDAQQTAYGQDPALANATRAQQVAAAGFGPTGEPGQCAPGENCPAQQNGAGQTQGGQQLSPAQQEVQQIAAKERELAYNSRFASNLVYAHLPEAHAQQAAPAGPESAMAADYQQNTSAPLPGPAASTLIAARGTGEVPASALGQAAIKRSSQVNIDAAVGQPYVIYEGLTLDTVLMNRLDGDAVGPVKVLVSNSVYSHDRQHVLIPDGTIVLGEARKIGSGGFGQQRRIAVVFHRMIMPDGYSVDLDQFHGLNQIGEEGLKDKVNNHYLQIFGASIALGIISGAGEITQGGGAISTSGSQAFTTGAAGSVSQSAATILDRFIQIPPTITIREGHRVKVYFTQDMLLPAYERHTIPQTF